MSGILGTLFLIGWVSGELLRWNGVIPVTLLDVAMILLLSRLAISRLINIRLPHPVKTGFAMTAGIGIGSWILGLRLFSIGESIHGLLYLLRILGYLIIIIQAKELFNLIKKWIYLALVSFVVLGLGQYVFLPDTRFLLQYGWDEHYYRLIGTVLDPNYLGAMLGMILIFSANQFLKTKKRKWGILGALGILGLIFTYSRASWTATGIGALIWGINKGNWRKLGEWGALGILIAFIIYLVAPKPGGEGVNIFRTFSIEQRIGSWKEGIVIWRKHPWLGVGFNNYAVTSGKTDHASNSPSNSWILGLDTLGIWGVLVIWGVLGRKIKNVTPVWNGIAVLLSIHAIFNNTLFYTPILGLVALIRAANEE